MGKYDAWDRYFAQLEGEEMELSFEQLEAALGAPMPASAYKFDTWWSNAHYYATWTNHGWFASPHIARRTVTFSRRRPLRGRKPQAVRTQKGRLETPETPGARPTDVPRRLILVGCVAQKRNRPAPAKDLYVSPLWRKRRAYAESTGQPWGILSSEYGYLDPDTLIEPYDRYMGDQPMEYRTSWSQSTADRVIDKCHQMSMNTVEVHAGASYLEHGLIAALNGAGIKVLWPLRGMKIGEQLSWYGFSSRPKDRTEPEEVPEGRSAPGTAPRLLSLHLIDAFDFHWPDAIEHFDYGWEGEADTNGRRIRVRHGVGHRVAYGSNRIHTVTFLDGTPAVEGVAADDYETSRSLLSLIKPDGRSMARRMNEVPPDYSSFTVVNHASEIEGPYTRHGFAVKIRVDDVIAWVHHGLLRRTRVDTRGVSARPATGKSEARADHESPNVNDTTKQTVVRRLLDFGSTQQSGAQDGMHPQLLDDPVANQFLMSNPLAFLLAVVADYQITAERAWTLPYLLKQRLGHLDPVRMLAEPERVYEAFAQRPALHRFVERVPEFMLDTCAIVINDYDGDASALWSDNPTAAELQERLRRIPGISQKKAAMAVEMIERDLGYPVRDMTGSDVAIDVHVRRVFLRAGLVEEDDAAEMLEVARTLHPKRPGALDFPSWEIGRTWCRPRDPLCDECVLGDVCPRLVSRGDNVKGA